METKVTCQEILIMHNSRFFSKELYDRDEPVEGERLSQKEQLADACRNGLIKEILPEISSSLSLIEINEAESFLGLCYGEFDQPIEKEFSIDPNSFLETPRWS